MRARARKYLNEQKSKEKILKKFGHLRTTYILNLNLLFNFFPVHFSILNTFHHFHEYMNTKKIEPTNKVSPILSVIKTHCVSIPFRLLNT